jgi:diguanylate cyclase (GGDEF)-like protein/PAS domain S-box-containing protein
MLSQIGLSHSAKKSDGPNRNDGHDSFIRGMQLHTYRMLLPFGLTASLFNSVVMISILAWRQPSAALPFWSGLMVVMGLLGLRTTWLLSKYKSEPKPRSAHALSRPITESALLGMTWAACPILFLPEASGYETTIILCVCGGMMTGAAFVLSTLPSAAIPFVVSLSFGTVIGMLRSGSSHDKWIMIAVIICFTIVMIRAAFWNHANYVRTWLQQVRLNDQAIQLEKKQSVISLLLNEFEQSVSDCLWEIDADGRLVRVSETLAERTGFTVAQLEGQPLLGFFDAVHQDGIDDLSRMRRALSDKQEFNDLCAPVHLNGSVRWWRLSAKPIFCGSGTFEGYRGVASDVTEKHKADQEIYQLAHFDSLTGFPKREYLLEEVGKTISASEGEAPAFALHSLDLDRFKTINDVFGHTVGDAFLQVIARRLQNLVGGNDMVARLGSDGFVILQHDVAGRDEAKSLADEILYELGKPAFIDGLKVQSTVSLGFALCPEHSFHAHELLKFADLALLEARKSGRNMHRVYEPRMTAEAANVVALEHDLREALERNEFALNFQPLFHTKSQRIGGFETLIRWNHPVRGSVSPDLFVPILEQAGLINVVGDWIIREALREASTWDASTRISINLSPLQARSGAIVATVAQALAQFEIEPARVDFEITETALFDDTEEILSTLRALRGLGVTISLDDFGTGYSSLALLQVFPFDKIKIDKSFVQQMETSDECRAIVHAVLHLAQCLGMRTTAEGVETQQHMEALVAEQCSELQGYFFGKPMAPQALVEAGVLTRKAPATFATANANAKLEPEIARQIQA